MCRPVPCKQCGKITWSGCGQHVAAVKASVPPANWCAGHPKTERPTGPRRSWLGRIVGR
ncbi:hypothetical protein [Nocardioides jiangxiensis]|uniref:Uncharacterized protein n=1 Tax=Nocardioides jiangxiensis TaxID=3064524 RepID=A0ABT9B043_9ACTN|nr:hypothetical protein [Nocardioides sp. WY-20]MDO7867598.1 hypothetical protein [Nocardioides sp. WY-20]